MTRVVVERDGATETYSAVRTIVDLPVSLSIHPDGRWEMSTGLGDSAGVVTAVVGDHLKA